MSDLEDILSERDVESLRLEILGDYINHGPFYVEFHLTDKCNSSCYFCNQQGFRHRAHEWDLGALETVIHRLADNGLRTIRLSGGGEPTCYPHIFEVVNLVSNRSVSISRLATNGLGLSPALSRMLVDAGLRTLHVSLQAPTAKSWSQVTGRNASDFYAIVRNVEEFVRVSESRDTYVYVSFIIDTPTVDSIPQMFSLCESMGCQLLVHDLNSFTYSDDFLRKCVPRLMEYLRSLDINDLKHIRFQTLEEPKLLLKNRLTIDGQAAERVACLVPWVGFMVRANGAINPCCAIQAESSILGNVFDRDIMDIWYGDIFSALRSEGKRLFSKKLSSNMCGRELEFLQAECLGECIVKHGMFGHMMIGKF